MKVEFLSKSSNESFARVVVASFVASLDPTLEEINDVKTAISEAVTNSIIHGYDCDENRLVTIIGEIHEREVVIEIKDDGKGIKDINQAKEPLFTTREDLERAGMGFAVMESFMDELIVESDISIGTRIIMKKRFTPILEGE